MPRAQAIAFLVLGSQGIAFTPIVVPSNVPPESPLRILRDMLQLEQEHQRAEQAEQRAEQLAARLQALGIDPDALL